MKAVSKIEKTYSFESEEQAKQMIADLWVSKEAGALQISRAISQRECSI